MIKCEDGYLYTGLTRDLDKRLKEHRLGCSPLTKSRGNINLVYRESFNSRIDAAKKEKEIKGWCRSKKESLINQFTSSD